VAAPSGCLPPVYERRCLDQTRSAELLRGSRAHRSSGSTWGWGWVRTRAPRSSTPSSAAGAPPASQPPAGWLRNRIR